MGTPYPEKIVTDQHMSQALIATATEGIDARLASWFVVDLCVRNWALRFGVSEEYALEVAHNRRPATRFIINRLTHDPKVEAALPPAQRFVDFKNNDAAIDPYGVEDCTQRVWRLLKTNGTLERRLKRLERDYVKKLRNHGEKRAKANAADQELTASMLAAFPI